MGGNNSKPQQQSVPANSANTPREVVPRSTQSATEPQYVTASGIPVVPRTQPSSVVAPDSVLQEFRAAYVEPTGRESEMGSM
ncbi:unnamed protein product [Aureobasidium vineae]|uniref:Uncharacterized protein n=1 Tax=Aureobasidium vineae TaxID=2773715 RepID=A0A9N8P7E1_9PEZI|nr:unnamed protein product [Aureobasidium vineae]